MGADFASGAPAVRPRIHELVTTIDDEVSKSDEEQRCDNVERLLPILYVDDEPDNLTLFRLHFERDFRVLTAGSGSAALELMAREEIAVLFSDERMPQMSGIELLSRVWDSWPDTVRIIVSAYSDAARLLNAINRGHAHEYILKPWDEAELRSCVERSLQMADRRRRLSARADRSDVFEEDLRSRANPAAIVGIDGGMSKLSAIARRAAAGDSTVLILGETGTGKELLARYVHDQSPRKDGPFIAVNCAALAEGVLESELYGHEQGAFTGAARKRRGRFELAEGGTLFLDEIGELPPKIQVSLLRVLQERCIERVGGNTAIPINARVVAATNRNLEKLIADGLFRQDLYYRLNVIPLLVPPLRERGQDLAALVEHFLEKWSRAAQRRRVRLEPGVIDSLRQYGWPGNVRELENLVQRALVLAQGDLLTVEDFAFQVAPPQTSVRADARDAEAAQLRELLMFHGGNCARAAAAIGIARTTLVSRLKKHGLL
jgi:DNA-binding NtrC family response regulator